MSVRSAGAAVETARGRIARGVLAAGVAAALTCGQGVWLVSPGAAAAAPKPGSGGAQLAAWAVTQTVPSVGAPIVVDPMTSTVYVGGINGLSLLNELTGKVTGTISLPLPDDLIASAVDPSTSTLYVINTQSVDVVSTKTGKLTSTIPVGANSSGIAVDEATDTIYVSNYSGAVLVIDGSTNTLSATLHMGGSPAGIAVDPLTNTIYVTDANGGTVSVIGGTTNTVTATIGVGQFPGPVAVNSATDTIYVANRPEQTVSVIDGATNKVTATVDADAWTGLAADPQTDTIYTLGLYGELGGLNGRTNEFEVSLSPSYDTYTYGSGLAIDPAAGTIYVAYAIENPENPVVDNVAIITSCRSHVAVAPASNCAQVAAGFEPVAATFASPEQGVVMGRTSCSQTECYQAVMMATADGGNHWSFLSPPPGIGIGLTQQAIAGLLFPRPDDGWLFGDWHTRDGGATWQRAGPIFPPDVLAMAASPTTVYAAVQPLLGHGELFATPIGATRWTRIPAINADATGLAVFGHSVWVTSRTSMWATTDGRYWHRYPSRCPGTGYRLIGVTATSPTQVAFLCNRPAGSGRTAGRQVLISVDGGRTVRLAEPAPAMGMPQGFASPPGDPAVITIAASRTGSSPAHWLYRSVNGGRTWTTLTINGDSRASFKSLTHTSSSTGWIILGDPVPNSGNTLLETTDGGRTWHKVAL